MPRTIAVTGATGFIGRMLVHHLLATGWSVRILVRQKAHADLPIFSACEQINGSLEEIESLSRLLDGACAVVHCAGVVRGADADDFDGVNVEGVRRLVDAALARSPRPRVLSLSSLAAREPGLSWYASSKRQGEQVLEAAGGGLEWVVLRPPPVYGPGDREMLPLFQWMARGIAPVLGEPHGRLSLLYVEDLTAAVLRWLDAGRCESGVFEITDTQDGGYSWDDISARVSALCSRPVFKIRVAASLLNGLAGVNLTTARLFGYAPMLTPGKVRELRHPDWVGHNGALTRAIGWKPVYSLEDGLRITMGWGEARSRDSGV